MSPCLAVSNARTGEYEDRCVVGNMEDGARIGVTRSWQALNARLKNQECPYDNNAATQHIRAPEVNTRKLNGTCTGGGVYAQW